MAIGFLVRSTANDLGIGKIVATNEIEATIEYFYSVGHRVREVLPLTGLQRIRLQRQTRCYLFWEETKTWRIGRIHEWDEDEGQYYVDLPDKRTILAAEAQIHVRCDRPIEEPIDILAVKGHETPYFHNFRSRFLRSYLRGRAVSHDMPGLLSANITLYPHQVETVRRVLEDPRPRYILADDSGSGKTIGAGAILRQFLLDKKEAKALILVPASLCHQWQQELNDKFYISQFGERVTILALEDSRQLQRAGDIHDFLLIDTADRLIDIQKENEAAFEVIRKIAHRVSYLLLLTSIPVLNHEHQYSLLLHLIDPLNYGLRDTDKLKDFIDRGAGLGEIILNNDLSNIEEVKTLFKKDKKISKVIAEIEKNEPSADFKDIIINYLQDNYRSHPRLLRNNREALQDAMFDRAATPKLEYELDERLYTLTELIEKWRFQAPENHEYRDIFRLFIDTFDTYLGLFKTIIDCRLKGKIQASLLAEIGQSNNNLLIGVPKFDGEEEILIAIQELLNQPSEDGDRLELLKIILLYHLADLIELQSFKNKLPVLQERVQQRLERPYSGDRFPKIIIFTHYSSIARTIVDFIGANFHTRCVTGYIGGESQENLINNLERFRKDAGCFILVVDRTLPAGINLQFADRAIHFDLPFSIVEVEKRLRALDRIGGKAKIDSLLIVGNDADDSYGLVRYEMLKEAWGIFHGSPAGLDRYADAKEAEIAGILFKSGGRGLLERIPSLKTEIEMERQKIAGRDALDRIPLQSREVEDYFRALEANEAAYSDLEKAVEGWLCKALQFRRLEDRNLDDIRTYKATGNTLIPPKDLKTYFAPNIDARGSYNRDTANKHAGVQLYRIGQKLIDTLADYLDRDDRGKAFALWRQEAAWGTAPEWVGFRFDYQIDLDPDLILPIIDRFPTLNLQEKALHRLGCNLFPPLLQTVFIDTDFRPVEDENLLKILKRPYYGKARENRDYNLAKERLEILNDFVSPEEWPDLCLSARRKSVESSRESPAFQAYCQQRRALAARYGRRGTELEGEIGKVYAKAIENPRFRADAVGFIIISGREPRIS